MKSPATKTHNGPTTAPRAIGIGNVIIDRSITVARSTIAALGYPERAMSLIDDATAEKIEKQFSWQEETAGGSVGNSLATIAALTTLVGREAATGVQFHGVASTDRGAVVFEESFAQTGGRAVLHKVAQSHTGQCFCFIDDDTGDRTMMTNLGSNVFFHQDTLQSNLIAQSRLVFLEGYIFDSPASKEAFTTIVAGKQPGQTIALTLSDHFCVIRHGADFLSLIKKNIDIVFANEAEILALTQTHAIDAALTAAAALAPLVVVTRSEKGVVVLGRGQPPLTVPAEKNIKVLDATGAGDQLAGGFLFGMLAGWDETKAAALGCRLAGAVIQRWGARLPINQVLVADFIK